MKKWAIILSLLLIVLIYAVWILSESVQSPEFVKIENCQLSKPDKNQTIVCHADVVLNNPNNINAKLIYTDINVYSDQLKVANISQTSVTNIPANNQFSVPITCNISLINAIGSQGLSGIIEKALSSERHLKLSINGFCRVSVNGHVFRIPVNYQETLVIK